VFTPYRNAWLKRLTEDDWQPCQTGGGGTGLMAAPGAAACLRWRNSALPPVICGRLGFVPGMSGGQQLLADFQGAWLRYRQQRDFPGGEGGFLSLGSPAFRDGVDS
jgi:deoxyribodipyrimidine photo-lyase